MYTEDDLVKALCTIHEHLMEAWRGGDEWVAEFFAEGDWAACVPNEIRKSLNLSPDEEAS
jgi:hypothetical protein